jgi:antitoxin component HigA of HigAB toxin-antitoxin module
MITLHTEADYQAALAELEKIWDSINDDNAIDREYFDHIVDAVIEYEDTHFNWE